jgi:hypothetical protein
LVAATNVFVGILNVLSAIGDNHYQAHQQMSFVMVTARLNIDEVFFAYSNCSKAAGLEMTICGLTAGVYFDQASFSVLPVVIAIRLTTAEELSGDLLMLLH